MSGSNGQGRGQLSRSASTPLRRISARATPPPPLAVDRTPWMTNGGSQFASAASSSSLAQLRSAPSASQLLAEIEASFEPRAAARAPPLSLGARSQWRHAGLSSGAPRRTPSSAVSELESSKSLLLLNRMVSIQLARDVMAEFRAPECDDNPLIDREPAAVAAPEPVPDAVEAARRALARARAPAGDPAGGRGSLPQLVTVDGAEMQLWQSYLLADPATRDDALRLSSPPLRRLGGEMKAAVAPAPPAAAPPTRRLGSAAARPPAAREVEAAEAADGAGTPGRSALGTLFHRTLLAARAVVRIATSTPAVAPSGGELSAIAGLSMEGGVADLLRLKLQVEAADADGSGALEMAEFCEAFGERSRFKLSEGALSELFLQVDANSDGQVSWEVRARAEGRRARARCVHGAACVFVCVSCCWLPALPELSAWPACLPACPPERERA
jgi:hypothetical protein